MSSDSLHVAIYGNNRGNLTQPCPKNRQTEIYEHEITSRLVAHTAENAWESMRSCMSRYPFAVFFTGMAVGALVVMAVRRRIL